MRKQEGFSQTASVCLLYLIARTEVAQTLELKLGTRRGDSGSLRDKASAVRWLELGSAGEAAEQCCCGLKVGSSFIFLMREKLGIHLKIVCELLVYAFSYAQLHKH